MSIYAYVGLPGSGKSYDVVANQILPALKAGRRVVTNIPLNMPELCAVVPAAAELLSSFPTEQVQSAPELIDQYAKPGCVLVLDEVWRLWPSGVQAKNVPEPFRKLLAEHRHMVDEHRNSMQIILVTQDLAQIGAFARQLVEMTFHHTKLSFVGAAGSYRIDVYNGPQSGPNPPKSSRLREIFGRYDAAIFKLYKSHTMSAAGEAGANEASVDARANVWKRPGIWVGLIGIVVVGVWAFVHFRHGLLKTPAGRERAGGALRLEGSSMGRSAATPQSRSWRVVLDVPELSLTYLSDGQLVTRVRLPDTCDRTTDGLVLCHWHGQLVTNEFVQVLPAFAPAAPALPGIASP